MPLVNRATCYKKKENWVKVEEDCRKALSLNGTLMKVGPSQEGKGAINMHKLYFIFLSYD